MIDVILVILYIIIGRVFVLWEIDRQKNSYGYYYSDRKSVINFIWPATSFIYVMQYLLYTIDKIPISIFKSIKYIVLKKKLRKL
jgi:hypothetical protein